MTFENIKDKKVLVMGLGTLGGGVATTAWLVKHGAKVTVTDLRSKKELTSSLKALRAIAHKVTFVLGKHRATDFKTHDIVVVNPAVRRESEFLKIARKAGRAVVNDARIFFDTVANPTIAVTGTRGKTTTTNWITHLLRAKDRSVAAAGNTPERPLLMDLDRLAHRSETTAVVELSSWQLEFLGKARRAPDIAVITNIYADHLNRYRDIEAYATAKAFIFQNQNPAQALILNHDNRWTPFFLRMKPRGKIYLFSTNGLPSHAQGIFIRNGALIFREASSSSMVANRTFVQDFVRTWGTHNLENLLAAMLAAHLSGLSWQTIIAHLHSLPSIPFRQEMIIRRKNLLVVNDSAGTSPDAVVAALARFKSPSTYLITGGTDKKLDFRGLARAIKSSIPAPRVFFLNGSATKKLISELARVGFFKKNPPQIFEDLPTILHALHQQLPVTNYQLPFTVLFSPGAASFEKFRNEFDRGSQFSRAVRRAFAR